MSERPWDDLITLRRVFDLHREGVERYGGTGDLKADTTECIEGVLGNAWTAEAYDPIEGAEMGLGFAAYLMIYLNRGHCFIDGNKRAAWLAMAEVLRSKNLELDATEEEAEELVMSVLADQMDARRVTFWIAERLELIH